MRIDIQTVLDNTARLVGKPDLPDAEVGDIFARLLGGLVHFDHSVIFAYRGPERPIDLFSTFHAEDYHVFVSLYQEGPYLLDPFYRAASSRRSGVFRMRDLAPDRFYSSEYFRSYYEKTGLAEEIGFFVPVEGDATVVLSLMRAAHSGPFPHSEVQSLAKAERLVGNLARHYWGGIAGRFEAGRLGAARAKRGDGPVQFWKAMRLTGREIGIVDLVLQGYSSESIGLRLGISTGTVKVHRRNIYRKLGISSQTQLLSLYLDNVREPA